MTPFCFAYMIAARLHIALRTLTLTSWPLPVRCFQIAASSIPNIASRAAVESPRWCFDATKGILPFERHLAAVSASEIPSSSHSSITALWVVLSSTGGFLSVITISFSKCSSDIHATTGCRSIPSHAADGDAGDLAGGVEAEHEARRVAAREDEFHDGEGLVALFLRLNDLGAQREAPYLLRSCDIAATASSVTWGAKAGAYCARSLRPAITSVNQRIAQIVRASPVGVATTGASSARVWATGATASRAISRAKPMRRRRAAAQSVIARRAATKRSGDAPPNIDCLLRPQ